MIACRLRWQVFSAASLASRWGGRWTRWLHVQEAARAGELRDASRRQSWILGRIAARQLIFEHFDLRRVSPRQIQIISQSAARQGCVPRVLIDGVAQTWSLSIAHTPNWVAVAVAESGCSIGIDVVDLESVCPDRLVHCLNADAGSRRVPSLLATAVRWAVAESAFKSLGNGRPFQPKRFRLCLGESHAARWDYGGEGGQSHGIAEWWPCERAVVALAERTPASGSSALP